MQADDQTFTGIELDESVAFEGDELDEGRSFSGSELDDDAPAEADRDDVPAEADRDDVPAEADRDDAPAEADPPENPMAADPTQEDYAAGREDPGGSDDRRPVCPLRITARGGVRRFRDPLLRPDGRGSVGSPDDRPAP